VCVKCIDLKNVETKHENELIIGVANEVKTLFPDLGLTAELS